jgi:arabinose-5-phosphate isomerase
VPHFKRIGTPIIAITGDPNSTLGRLAYSHINASVKLEACSLNLAPTASTTVALALGDALAVVLLEMRGFKANDFALTHPAGSLGRRLFVKVEDLMRTGKNLPSVGPEKSVAEAVLEMSAKRMGMTCVTNKDEEILGILTDGDLRRIISRGTDIHKELVSEVMSKKALTIENNSLASEAALKMEKEKINHLLVVNGRGRLIGALGIHDLLEAKIL